MQHNVINKKPINNKFELNIFKSIIKCIYIIKLLLLFFNYYIYIFN